MLKNILKIMSVLMMLFVLAACYLPNEPDVPEKSYDTVEFMYVRVLQVIHPEMSGTKGSTISSDEFGGINMPPWTSVGVDKWQVEQLLYYSKRAYHIYTIDMKVTDGYVAVAEDFYAKVKGTQEWKKLPVSENGEMIGKWANFYFDSNGIHY